MKKLFAGLLALCILTACSGERAEESRYEEPVYALTPQEYQERFTGEDGRELARCTHQLLELSVTNGEALTREDREEAERNVAAFNRKMVQRKEAAMESCRELGRMAEEDQAVSETAPAYYDETAASGWQVGRLISVRLDNSAFTGGAHPNSYTAGYLFDLDTGSFIGPGQVADDPAAFIEAVAALLTEKAEEQPEELRSGYWPNYRDILANWNQGTVLFDGRGLTAVFSPYELGPYALGSVELTVSYEELKPLLGPGGLAKLGIVMP